MHDAQNEFNGNTSMVRFRVIISNRKTQLATGVATLVLAASIVYFYARGGKAEVLVETAERRDVPVVVELPAQTEASATVEIRANVEGRLIEMSFHEGNMVKKGQVLFRIDPRRCAAALQLAKAALEKAKGDLEMAKEQQHLVNAQSALRQADANLLRSNLDAERMKPLAARKAVPERDLDAAIAAQSSALAAVEDARATVQTTTVSDRVGLKQAQASLTAAIAAQQNAELDFEETTIRAPIDGLIGRTEVSVGNYVGRGEASRLATVSPLDPINVGFSIPEALYLRTYSKIDRKAMEHLEFILADNRTYAFRGKYTNIGRAMDAKTGTIQIEAQFPNPTGILVPGMSGKIRMPIENRASAVLVSEHAVFDNLGSKAVDIVTPDNKVTIRTVETEGSYQGKSIVTNGLGGGETVIVEGTKKFSPGQRVATKTVQVSH
jgi:membrane fusion protein (multidrug efflux system)